MQYERVPDHDHSYKLLFSHAQMVRDLLEGFVREDWLEQLDYGSLEKVSGSYVSDDLRDRTADIVWRVRWGGGWIYVYLLIEFQSTVERFMAVRILTYVGLLYQDLIRSGHITEDGLLPPVLPIVLYNGTARWGAPQHVAPLIQTGPSALERYRAEARYLLIDESRYGAGAPESTEPLRNLVTALFRLEHSRSLTEIQDVLGWLVEWLKARDQASLRRVFAVWLHRVILPDVSVGHKTAVTDLEEIRTMLADRFEEWAEEFKQQWMLEGRQEGRREGEALLLQRLLVKRFGALPEWVGPRLRQASLEQLDRWGDRLLEADSLGAVFDDM